jgi:hydroxymethylpyrimidine pyrophosphatase-like HAD family hydrolase
VERADECFLAEVRRYYARLEVVEDLRSVHDDVLKVAVFDFVSADTTVAPALERFQESHQVVVSGWHWVDVMSRTTHKGAALRHLQDDLGIGPEATMVFGDYLNDLQMVEAAEYSFAMANAHPDVLAAARYVAPANTEDGVVRVISQVLDLDLGVDPL